MTIHIEGMTLVPDEEIERLRKLVEASRLVMSTKEWWAIEDNLSRVEERLHALATTGEISREPFEIDYGSVSLRRIGNMRLS